MAATHTTNLNLNKPARTDFVSVVSDINDNMDILDGAIGAVPQGETVQGQISVLDSDKAPKASPVFTGSISLGRKANTNIGTNSVATGEKVEASGNYSHVEGRESVATGDYSHAEGSMAVSSGNRSHAEGVNTESSGTGSHAEGFMSLSSGQYSHAEGYKTTASGHYSHSEGSYTVANHRNQHSSGEFSVSDPSTAAANERGTYIEIVGNGTSSATSDRSNARVLDWNGNEKLKGDIYVNCNSDSTGGSKVLSESRIATVAETQAIINEYSE